MKNREDGILSQRLADYLRTRHRDVWEQIRTEVISINDADVANFVIGSEFHRIEFNVWDRDLSYEFLDYRSSVELFPRPEDGVIDFVELLRAFLDERKLVLAWQGDELEPNSELIDNHDIEFYSFLWESAPNAWVKSWRHTYSRVLRGAEPGATDNPDSAGFQSEKSSSNERTQPGV